MENFTNEIWKDIPEYDGLYQASDYGRIFSVKNNCILKQLLGTKDYMLVRLYKKGIGKTLRVHRLVWETFNGPIPKGIQVNHINEIKSDNRLLNLNLMSCKENCNWGTRNKRLSDKWINTKKQSKEVSQYTLTNELIKIWPSQGEIQRQLGYTQGKISLCCNHKIDSAYGYIWRFK